MLEAGSICHGHRCTAGILEEAAGYAFPHSPWWADVSLQDKVRGCSANCTFVDSTDLVPVSVVDTPIHNPSATEERLAVRPIWKGSSMVAAGRLHLTAWKVFLFI